MAKIKRKLTICEVRVACDGADIMVGKEMCGACRKKISRKPKKAAPVK